MKRLLYHYVLNTLDMAALQTVPPSIGHKRWSPIENRTLGAYLHPINPANAHHCMLMQSTHLPAIGFYPGCYLSPCLAPIDLRSASFHALGYRWTPCSRRTLEEIAMRQVGPINKLKSWSWPFFPFISSALVLRVQSFLRFPFVTVSLGFFLSVCTWEPVDRVHCLRVLIPTKGTTWTDIYYQHRHTDHHPGWPGNTTLIL